jgi:siroheme synthase (precorrin-2 oxidase/ferrochelatase)
MQVLANMAYVLLFASWKSIQHLIFGELREFERKVHSCTAQQAISYVPSQHCSASISADIDSFMAGCRD